MPEAHSGVAPIPTFRDAPAIQLGGTGLTPGYGPTSSSVLARLRAGRERGRIERRREGTSDAGVASGLPGLTVGDGQGDVKVARRSITVLDSERLRRLASP